MVHVVCASFREMDKTHKKKDGSVPLEYLSLYMNAPVPVVVAGKIQSKQTIPAQTFQGKKYSSKEKIYLTNIE